MKLEEKRLWQAFRGFELQNIPEALRNAIVCSIKLINHEKRVEVYISLEEIPETRYIAALEEMLLTNLEVLERVDIIAACNVQGKPQQLLESFWDIMIFRLSKISPLLGEFIRQTHWCLENDTLRIAMPKDTDVMLKKMEAANCIKNILADGINLSLKVEFDCLAAKKNIVKAVTKRPEVRDEIPKKSTETKPRPKNIQKISGEIRPLNGNFFEDEKIVVQGRIFRLDSREIKGKKLLYIFDIFDGTGSMTVKFFLDQVRLSEYADLLSVGSLVKAAGQVQFDKYAGDLTIIANKLRYGESQEADRLDNAPCKRVELHLHTNMSQLDGLTPASDFVKQAAAWGHSAMAITDHGVVQAYPEAMEAAKKAGIKLIYGIEAYLVDDMDVAIAVRPGETRLDEEFVVFDLETTGLSRERCTIIEIGAVKVRGGQVVDTFHRLIDPKKPLPREIIELTRITDQMLTGQPTLDVVLPEFLNFIGNDTLVAHNADFDMGFLEHHSTLLGHEVKNPYICTLQLSRALFPNLARHGLAAMVKHHGVNLENHHRASDDAAALAQIFLQQLQILNSQQIVTLNHINLRYAKKIDVKSLRPFHAIILVKNLVGLRNLYELVSMAHTKYFHRQPRIPKSELIRLREGLLVGTACESGEFYRAVFDNRPIEQIEALAEFYDYLEIHPIANNQHLIRDGGAENVEQLEDINRKIVEYGETYGKPVVAAGDAHFLHPGQEISRAIIMAGNGFKDADNQPPLYFMTTEEMLANFAYLGEETAYKVVVENTNLIADMIEAFHAIPDGTFAPVFEGSDKELEEIVINQAKATYGDPLPDIIQKRIDSELYGIINGGYASMYIAARKLVANSMENGYLVGSRGSVGSSFVATMAGITEVNPLFPHYFCPNCQFTDFDSQLVASYAGASGCDMPDRPCPNCNTRLKKDGHSIPFETFLGFNADKDPDIDLNFSGEYQAQAHAYAEELFGEGYVFKAGTISTIAERTAYGYVKKYLEERGRMERGVEVNRLAVGCTGIKRTTGQHPGGLVLVPRGKSIYEFTPIQHPANDTASGVVTTHFDFHSLEGRLLKLDILGHDVPTIMKLLHDMTGLNPTEVDIADKDVLSLFRSPEKLGVSERDINCRTGTLGLPEFGTSFVRQMLMDTQPASFADLARISGLSHGTDVWLNNGADLVRQKVATLKEIPSIRDDIMTFLIMKGVEKLDAFKITEKVRKGKGVSDEEEEIMLAAKVPRWYIESCRKVQYMFPKGHAVAYVMMATRIGYYKIHYPAAFYAAIFSAKSTDFDYEKMCKGAEIIHHEMRRISAMGNEATQKDEKSMVLLELVNEMYARGLNFAKLDIYQADADKFILMEDGKLMPPLCAVPGLGSAVADLIVQARKEGEFFSIEDLKARTKVNKNVVQLLKDNGVLDGMPETEQMTFL